MLSHGGHSNGGGSREKPEGENDGIWRTGLSFSLWAIFFFPMFSAACWFQHSGPVVGQEKSNDSDDNCPSIPVARQEPIGTRMRKSGKRLFDTVRIDACYASAFFFFFSLVTVSSWSTSWHVLPWKDEKRVLYTCRPKHDTNKPLETYLRSPLVNTYQCVSYLSSAEIPV